MSNRKRISAKQTKYSKKTLEAALEQEYSIENLNYLGSIPGVPKPSSLFLVISYDKKYLKVEKAIKHFFSNIYKVKMAREFPGSLLKNICSCINKVDFGIVVMAGLKTPRKKKCIVKFNIPFEYGMLQICEKPVLLFCESRMQKNLEIKNEFSDISNEQYGWTFDAKGTPTGIEKSFSGAFKKFIPFLAKHFAQRAPEECAILSQMPIRKARRLTDAFETFYTISFNDQFRKRLLEEEQA